MLELLGARATGLGHWGWGIALKQRRFGLRGSAAELGVDVR
jgi:hypothetical protein